VTTDTTFFDCLPYASTSFSLSEPVQTARLGDGSIIKGSLGAALWRGEMRLHAAKHPNLAETEARLAKLMRPGQFFLAYDSRFNGPAADVGGVILGSSTPVIHTVAANNREMRVSGLPSGYVLTAGDYIGWQYGSPARYGLHRLVTGATASGAGLTPLFEVAPFIRPGVVVGSTAVVLVRPPIKAVLESSDYGSGAPRITQGASLRFIQTLR